MSGSGGWKLVVAEKPSVARDIARVLSIRGGGKGVIGAGAVRVTWCLGHLVELEEPDRTVELIAGHAGSAVAAAS